MGYIGTDGNRDGPGIGTALEMRSMYLLKKSLLPNLT